MNLHQRTVLSMLAGTVAVAGLITSCALAQTVVPPMSLTQAVATGTDSNPTVLSAREAALAAGARVEQAEAQTRLTLSFNETGSVSDADPGQPPPVHETFGALQNAITLTIPIGRKVHLAVDQASAQAAAAEQQYRSAVVTLTDQIVDDYFDLLKKQAAARDASDALSAARDLLAQARRRNALGDVPDLDVLRSQVAVSAADAGLTEAQNLAGVALETLNAAMGRPLEIPTEN
ncbi:MAG: TolC family protein [Capsulimonadaceae bacterium]